MTKTTLSCMIFLLSSMCYSNGEDTEDVLSNEDLTKSLKEQADKMAALSDLVHHQDKTIKEQRTDLQVLRQNVSDMEKTADTQNKLIKEQEKELKEQQDKTNALEKTVAEQEKHMKDKRAIGTSNQGQTVTIAFSYAYAKDILKIYKPMLFPTKIMSIGDAYDPKTGVFTAPRDGLYVFHLTVLTYYNNDKLWIDLEVNEKLLVWLFIRDGDYRDQGSVSTVTSLKAGDQVSPVVSFHSTKNRLAWGWHHSTFSGYLLKLL